MNMSVLMQQNSNDHLDRLLQAIRINGLDNITALSEEADLPTETARYMIWYELPKRNLGVEVEVNFERIGLKRWMLEFVPSDGLKATGMNGILGNDVGITYSARVLPRSSFVSLLGIPLGQHYKLWMKLEELVRNGTIKRYSLQEIQSLTRPTLNHSFFDLRRGNWHFDWKDVENYRNTLISDGKISTDAESGSPKIENAIVDYKDLLILREFQKRIPRSITKVTKSIGGDHHSMRYHYNHHVKQVISGYRIKVLPENLGKWASFLFTFVPASQESQPPIRSVALSLPFTTAEWSSQNRYNWIASCPGEYSSEMLHYIDSATGKIKGNLEISILDTKTEFHATVPYLAYDEARGEWNYEPKISSDLSTPFQKLRTMCKYEMQSECIVHDPNNEKCDISTCPFVSRE